MEPLFGVGVKLDTGWLDDGGLKHRGIYDYKRIIQFERELFPNEFEAISRILGGKGCPGFFGVSVRKVNESDLQKIKPELTVDMNSTYIYFTTADSSD